MQVEKFIVKQHDKDALIPHNKPGVIHDWKTLCEWTVMDLDFQSLVCHTVDDELTGNKDSQNIVYCILIFSIHFWFLQHILF